MFYNTVYHYFILLKVLMIIFKKIKIFKRLYKNHKNARKRYVFN